MQDQRLMPALSAEMAPSIDLPRQAYTDLAPPREQADLHYYWTIIYKRKWLIASVVLLVTALAALYMYRQPNIYEAETTIRIEQKNESFLRSKDIVINTASDPIYWHTQLKLLENPQLMRQLVLTLDLQNNPAFLGAPPRKGLLSTMRGAFSRPQPAAQPAEPQPAAPTLRTETQVENLTAEQRARLAPYVNTLLGGLTVEPVAATNLVKIRFAHTNPEIAMKVADTLANLFINDDMRRETIGSQNAARQLARQIADLQLTVKQQEEERLNFIKNHELPLGQVKGQNLTAERLETLSGQLLSAENERKNLQARYESARRSRDVWSIPEVQEHKGIQELRVQIRDLEKRRAAMLVKYTPDWPDVIQLDEEIKRLKQDLTSAPSETVAAMKSRYEAALARENDLRQAYLQERGAANQQSQSEIELGNLNQQLETNKQLYNTLLQHQRELELESNDRSPNVSIATPSELPLSPVGPPRTRNIFIAFLLSLFAGIGLAIVLQKFNDTLKSAEEVAGYTRLPMLSVVPAFRRTHLMLGSNTESTALDLIQDVRSPISEAYRHLRTSLLFSSHMEPPRTMLVTSGQAMEGKTTTAVNTAVIFAQTGADVLLLDCDLRRPRVHSHFGLPTGPGLTEYLSGEVDLEDTMRPYSKLPNLKVITSGAVPANPAELLGSEEMRWFLKMMGQRFTHIIIDSPPAISFTDAIILSTLVDGVVMVVQGGRSSRSTVRRVQQQLMNIGANIYGTVLNNARQERNDYYYNYYSNYFTPEGRGATVAISQSTQTTETRTWVSFNPEQVEQAFEKFRREKP
jgi:capsular exopolysaccharide synthesis family protein